MDFDKIRALLSQCIQQNGVFYLHKDVLVDEKLEELDLKVRAKEGRQYDDATVSKIPDIGKEDTHYEQWLIRKSSAEKLIEYLSQSGRDLCILDLGCGNGWFSNKLAMLESAFVIGLDINRYELEQAARVFKKDNLHFLYSDIYDEKLSDIRFDIIVLNAAVQYFPDVDKLMGALLNMLDPKGEIHILDTPLYSKSNVDAKTIISEIYYDSIGFPEMTSYYHHHLMTDFSKYKPDILHKPKGVINRLKNLLFHEHLSPFPWLRIRKSSS
jgi:SAM-dependent methyltransferase